MKYGDVVWHNCTEEDKLDLEKLQRQAIRVITGCTLSTSSANLYSESKFQTLESRRIQHSLVLFYKIANNLTGARLRELLPQQVSQRTAYNLRNNSNFTPDFARTTSHLHSFFPSTVRHWNNLSIDTRNSATLSIFKRKLNLGVNCAVKSYYYIGKRSNVIHHTRIRNNCSNLNGDLFSNHVRDSPACSCGVGEETATHYFFTCPKYVRSRDILDRELQEFNIDIDVLLYGNVNLNDTENAKIFKCVQDFIHRTKRFDPP